jgi:hypothetical protein
LKILLSKQRLQLMLCLLFVGTTTLFVSSCKKNTTVETPEPIEEKPVYRYDSVYYEIGGKAYVGKTDNLGFNGFGNSGYRMRYLDAPQEGMKSYFGSSGENGWYGTTDSIYFSAEQGFKIDGNYSFVISFSQGFHKSEMKSPYQFYPNDIRNMLKKGKQTFASDFQSTNFKNGVALEIGSLGRTGKPEYDFKQSIADFPQDDSIFEITNTEKIDEKKYLVEAKFELNLYGKDRAKTRVNNGYIRFTVLSQGIGTKLF